MLFNVFRRNRKNGAKLLHTSTRTQNGLLKRRKTTSSTSYHSVVVLFIFEQHVFNSTRRKWIKLCTMVEVFEKMRFIPTIVMCVKLIKLTL
ncbi:unnamed protein product [Tenebrio molitor]|nr:unnamed protein product [Tenebrio molitor]